jgi:hypothetical protein
MVSFLVSADGFWSGRMKHLQPDVLNSGDSPRVLSRIAEDRRKFRGFFAVAYSPTYNVRFAMRKNGPKSRVAASKDKTQKKWDGSWNKRA